MKTLTEIQTTIELFEVSKSVFESDLKTCLELLYTKNNVHTCVYTSPSLKKKIVNITVK